MVFEQTGGCAGPGGAVGFSCGGHRLSHCKPGACALVGRSAVRDIMIRTSERALWLACLQSWTGGHIVKEACPGPVSRPRVVRYLERRRRRVMRTVTVIVTEITIIAVTPMLIQHWAPPFRLNAGVPARFPPGPVRSDATCTSFRPAPAEIAINNWL